MCCVMSKKPVVPASNRLEHSLRLGWQVVQNVQNEETPIGDQYRPFGQQFPYYFFQVKDESTLIRKLMADFDNSFTQAAFNREFYARNALEDYLSKVALERQSDPDPKKRLEPVRMPAPHAILDSGNGLIVSVTVTYSSIECEMRANFQDSYVLGQYRETISGTIPYNTTRTTTGLNFNYVRRAFKQWLVNELHRYMIKFRLDKRNQEGIELVEKQQRILEAQHANMRHDEKEPSYMPRSLRRTMRNN